MLLFGTQDEVKILTSQALLFLRVAPALLQALQTQNRTSSSAYQKQVFKTPKIRHCTSVGEAAICDVLMEQEEKLYYLCSRQAEFILTTSPFYSILFTTKSHGKPSSIFF